MKVRSKSERNALAFAMISFGFTGKIPSDLKLNQSNLILFDAIKSNFVAKKQGGREKQLANSSKTVHQSLSDNIYQITDNIHSLDKSSSCINTQNEKQLDLETAIKKVTRFVKPTAEEIKSYCEETERQIDADRFLDYYNANGWKVGKNPMKDWKAAVRNWTRDAKPAKVSNDEACWF